MLAHLDYNDSEQFIQGLIEISSIAKEHGLIGNQDVIANDDNEMHITLQYQKPGVLHKLEVDTYYGAIMDMKVNGKSIINESGEVDEIGTLKEFKSEIEKTKK